MTREELDKAKTWLNQHITMIRPEEPSIDAILAVAKALVLRKGIRGLVIDPWNEIEHGRTQGQTETEYISIVLSRIRQFARAHGVHVWLAAHPAKLFKEANGKYPVPGPYDVSGSAHWRNKADNCISVWRDELSSTGRVEVHVQKIRHKATGKIGMVVMAYDLETGRYNDGNPNTAPNMSGHGNPFVGTNAEFF